MAAADLLCFCATEDDHRRSLDIPAEEAWSGRLISAPSPAVITNLAPAITSALDAHTLAKNCKVGCASSSAGQMLRMFFHTSSINPSSWGVISCCGCSLPQVRCRQTNNGTIHL